MQMSAEVNQSVEDESLQAGAQATETEVMQDDEARKQQEAEQRKRNDAEYNWAEMRRQMREKDQQIDDLNKRFSQLTPRPSPEEDDLSKLAEDDILTVAQAKKLATKMARNAAEEVYKQREANTVEERVQLKFPDYAEIVTKENIELLKLNEPELAQSLAHMPDPYSQAVAAYKLLKKVGKEAAPSNEKRKAMENSQKPVSVNAVTKSSAIGNAHLFENGLTPDLKKQMWAEMQQAMKGH